MWNDSFVVTQKHLNTTKCIFFSCEKEIVVLINVVLLKSGFIIPETLLCHYDHYISFHVTSDFTKE